MSTLQTTTSSSRPSAQVGDTYFETDTKDIIVYDGSNWRVYNPDTVTGWSGTNNYSLNFDGTDDYLTAASIVTPTAQQGTISAWVKSTTSNFGPIFNISSNTDTHTGYWMGLQFSGIDAGKLEFGLRPNASDFIYYRSSNTYNDGNWHHVAVTSNESSYKLFIDGAEDTGAATSGSSPSNVVGGWIDDMAVKNSCNIGAQRRNADKNNHYFNGNIDELAIWDSALTADQIDNIYHGLSSTATQFDRDAVTAGDEAPGNLMSFSPKAWWSMGDGVEANSGPTIYDMSSFSNDMTIVNAASGTNTAGAAYQLDTP